MIISRVGGKWESFHHNLPDGLAAFGLDVHHVDAFGHLRQVDADLVAFHLGVVNHLSVGVHDADVAQAFAFNDDFALGRVGVDVGGDAVLADAFRIQEVSY